MEKFSPSPTTASRLAFSAAIRASSILAGGDQPGRRTALCQRRLRSDSGARPQRTCGAREQKRRRIESGRRNFGPDGRYYVGLRSERTIMAFARKLNSVGEYILPPHVV